MPASEKICLFCRRDCSDRERVVDDRGRYACRACLESAKRIRAAEAARVQAAESDASAHADQAPEPTNIQANSDTAAETAFDISVDGTTDLPEANLPRALHGVLDEPTADPTNPDTAPFAEFLGDGPDDSVPGSGSGSDSGSGSSGTSFETGVFNVPSTDTCPNCGAGVPPFSVLCVSCGADMKTGELPGEDDEHAAPQPGFSMPLWPAWGLGAATLTAIAWVMIRANLGVEAGVLAIAVGIAAGLGVLLGARGRVDAWKGVFAAIAAVVCAVAGKLGGAALAAYDTRADAAQYDTEHKELFAIANLVTRRWTDEDGRELDWPAWSGPEIAAQDYRHWPYGYPTEIEAEARQRWDALSDAERNERAARTAESLAPARLILADLSPFDLVWGLLAIGAAYALGAGVGMPPLRPDLVDEPTAEEPA